MANKRSGGRPKIYKLQLSMVEVEAGVRESSGNLYKGPVSMVVVDGRISLQNMAIYLY